MGITATKPALGFRAATIPKSWRTRRRHDAISSKQSFGPPAKILATNIAWLFRGTPPIWTAGPVMEKRAGQQGGSAPQELKHLFRSACARQIRMGRSCLRGWLTQSSLNERARPKPGRTGRPGASPRLLGEGCGYQAKRQGGRREGNLQYLATRHQTRPLDAVAMAGGRSRFCLKPTTGRTGWPRCLFRSEWDAHKTTTDSIQSC